MLHRFFGIGLRSVHRVIAAALALDCVIVFGRIFSIHIRSPRCVSCLICNSLNLSGWLIRDPFSLLGAELEMCDFLNPAFDFGT